MKTKIDFKNYFEEDLFSDEDVTFIMEKIDKNVAILFAQEEYLNINDKVIQIKRKINSMMNSEIRNLFKKYERHLSELNSLQNCLAYYIGLQRAIKIDDIK